MALAGENGTVIIDKLTIDLIKVGVSAKIVVLE